MHEPGVAVTDYVLALVCAVLAVLLLREQTRSPWARAWAVVFFLALCVASIAGGTTHGFFPDEHSAGARVIWMITLYAIGVTALATWMLGARVLFRVVEWPFRAWAYGQFALYLVITSLVTQEFWTTMLTYVPASLFLTVAVLVAFRRYHDANYLLMLVGLGLTFVAASVQRSKLAVDPVYFNHNAVYHVIQTLALLFLFMGCRRLLRPLAGRVEGREDDDGRLRAHDGAIDSTTLPPAATQARGANPPPRRRT